jgi:hypothetical protein
VPGATKNLRGPSYKCHFISLVYIDGYIRSDIPEAKWRRKDQLALSNIALALKPSEQERIYNCITAEDAWNSLKEMYEGKGTHRFSLLLKLLSTAKLKDDVKMKDYIRGVCQTAD